jgi:hypothetical protein
MSNISDVKKIGRPVTGVGTPVTVRMSADQLTALDAWISQQAMSLSRPEGIRLILREKFA